MVFDLDILESRPGYVVLFVKGKNAEKAFKYESGGHRFQRVPPNEKRGRVHTSTITVAVLPQEKNATISINENDLEYMVCRSGGAGGQHVNKTNSAVQLRHKPSGIMVRIESRSQHANRQDALEILKSKLLAERAEKLQNERNGIRKNQIGAGMRGDKVRTIAVQHDLVHDHTTNKKTSYKQYSKGNFEWLVE